MFPKAAVGYRQIEVARRLLVLEQTAQRGTWSRLAGWGALKVGAAASLFMGSSGLPASPSPTAATTTSTDIFVRNLYMHALVAPAMTSQEPCMLLCTGRGSCLLHGGLDLEPFLGIQFVSPSRGRVQFKTVG